MLLRAWADGDAAAFEQLVPLVHRELHKIARVFMAAEGAGHSLQPTALLNEAYLRLIGGTQVEWRDRAHFFATSARLMRRILVDVARSKRYLKRGGGAAMAPLDDAVE
jgi:RNA polymerase sigma-70 factor (ECF subfamily)